MFEQIKHFMIDMDGVLWRGDTPLPGLVSFFDTLNEYGHPFLLATNNASKTPAMYVERLAKFGVAVEEKHILTSAMATADFLQGEYEAGTAVYISGGIGIQQAMREYGFAPISTKDVYDGAIAPLVVIGLNPQVCYKELAAATLLVNKGARFIGTNPDTSFPSELGELPGAGALIGLVEIATGTRAIKIGKPGKQMFLEGMKRLGSIPQNTAMIGDRLGTDIEGGHGVDMQTILVLSGITQPDELPSASIKPDFIFDDIRGIEARIRQQT